MEARTRLGAQVGGALFLKMEPGGDEIALGFSRYADGIKDWRPSFHLTSELFRRHEKRHFKSGGRSTGDPFRPLSEKYKKAKDAVRPGVPILTLDGFLRDALSKRGALGSLQRISPTAMLQGINPATLRPVVPDTAHLAGDTPISAYALAHVGDRPPVRYSTRLNKRIRFGSERSSLREAIRDIFAHQVVEARKVILGVDPPPPATPILNRRTF
jgi:hypothetical protein